uniref:sterile alpha motif domain-containing protein 1-like n=1 Tax=Callithrix jacchus TaxID=9483 RepID=UPI0023DD19D0|nr:sterile alpha motif domain-containing protein 1-like [Callithrix jacchus]
MGWRLPQQARPGAPGGQSALPPPSPPPPAGAAAAGTRERRRRLCAQVTAPLSPLNGCVARAARSNGAASTWAPPSGPPTRPGSPDAPASSPHPTPQPIQRGSGGCRAVSLAGRHRPS